MKRNFKPSVSSFLAMAAVLFFVACSKETDIPSDRNMEPKKAVHITDEAKLAMINSVKNLDGSGRLYMVDYHCCPEKFYHKVGCSTEPASGTLTGVVG